MESNMDIRVGMLIVYQDETPGELSLLFKLLRIEMMGLLSEVSSVTIVGEKSVCSFAPEVKITVKTILTNWTHSENVDFIVVYGKEIDFLNEDLDCQITKSIIQEDRGLHFLISDFLLNCHPRCAFFVQERTLILKHGTTDIQFPHLLDDTPPRSTISAVLDLLRECSGLLPCNFEISSSGNLVLKSRVQASNVAQRPRMSPFPMISVSEALDLIKKESFPLKAQLKGLDDCFSYVTAEAICSEEPYPPFRASIKDGYAVLSDDPSEVRDVIGVVTPGYELDFNLIPGTCVRVSTGSAVPDKATAVIQVEDTTIVEQDEQGNEVKIKILKSVLPLQDIRHVGCDVTKGENLISQNKKITAADIGVMATCGIHDLLVYDKPKVALLSTGDELVHPRSELTSRPGCIRDSNKSCLFYMLLENRIPVIDIGISKDDADHVKYHLTSAFSKADVVITTGGVSMGEKDILKQTLEKEFNATIHFGRIFMKPGKPCTFSTVKFNNSKKLVFSLPGNPVSACVCFHLFVMPCIRKLMGYTDPMNETIQVEVTENQINNK